MNVNRKASDNNLEVLVFGKRPAQERLSMGLLGKLDRLRNAAGEIDWTSLGISTAMMSTVFLLVGGAAYSITDVVGQPDKATMAQVLDTNFTPSYMQTTYVSDDKGNMSPRTIYVPESYSALIQIPELQEPTQISVSKRSYADLVEASRNGTTYEASFREGKWSHRVRMVDLKEPLVPAEDAAAKPASRRPSW